MKSVWLFTSHHIKSLYAFLFRFSKLRLDTFSPGVRRFLPHVARAVQPPCSVTRGSANQALRGRGVSLCGHHGWCGSNASCRRSPKRGWVWSTSFDGCCGDDHVQLWCHNVRKRCVWSCWLRLWFSAFKGWKLRLSEHWECMFGKQSILWLCDLFWTGLVTGSGRCKEIVPEDKTLRFFHILASFACPYPSKGSWNFKWIKTFSPFPKCPGTMVKRRRRTLQKPRCQKKPSMHQTIQQWMAGLWMFGMCFRDPLQSHISGFGGPCGLVFLGVFWRPNRQTMLFVQLAFQFRSDYNGYA